MSTGEVLRWSDGLAVRMIGDERNVWFWYGLEIYFDLLYGGTLCAKFHDL
jgi:hypothetical protein